MAQARRDTARLRALIVLVVLVSASALGVWLILRSDTHKGAPQATSASCVHETKARVLTKADIRIRVLNATARAGLATKTAAELRLRGYTVTAVGNDPSAVLGPAEMRYGSGGAPSAKALKGLVVGAVNRPITRAGADVDLVLGNTFTRLAPAPAPAPALAPVKAVPGCPATATPTR
ncbi:MAG: LytR C-terminal domain-containing protein [Actinomycetota bacterium]|nr:LytR C-terminal domain-containing protein [Actinomycetota bacterium]